jgi:fatty acid CoA ligase FadD36
MRRYGRIVHWEPGGPIKIGDESMPRDDLHATVVETAAGLAGAPPVAVVAHPAMSTVITILAALEAGVPVIPVSPDTADAERAHVLADSGAGLLVDADVIVDVPARSDRRLDGATDAALILYTSGTTGAPKGVPIRLDAIRSCVAGLAEAWAWTPDDTLVHGLPLFHVHGLVLGLLGPLLVGSSLTHTGRPTPAAYAAAGGSLYFGVPTVWARIAQEPEAARSLRRARLLVSGSAPLPGTAFDALLVLAGQAPVERYGMTETLITLAADAHGVRHRGSVGRPLPGVTVRIVDDHGAEVPIGDMGELQVVGDSVFDGYLHRPDATSASFTGDGWFRTGDIATRDAEGLHRIVGRASTDLIKSGGYRIGAGEVEDALLSHPAVTQAAVVGQADDDLGERIVAYVVADGADARSLGEHAASRLARHKQPRSIVLVSDLPRNAMGKVDKSRLRGARAPTMTEPPTDGDST